MRLSKYFMPTKREVPADAEINSHKWMIRAALMRQTASGVYAYMPLGWRVMRKIEDIVREEMDRSGALELHMPALLSADLLRESGRWEVFGEDMFRLHDRNDRDFCLGPTHEEMFTDMVKANISSYRSFPMTLYQIQTKFRDERRPRYGVMRSKEFIMKDAYSFDIDAEGLDKSYVVMRDAYKRIFKRVGVSCMPVEADSGAMGGSGSQEFMVPSEVGEDDIAVCECGYAANVEKAPCCRPAFDGAPEEPMELRETPNSRTIAEVTEFLGREPEAFAKTMIYSADGKPVAVMVRGDREINEQKLQNKLGCVTLELADAATVSEVTGAEVGFAGPVGLKVPLYVDYEVAARGSIVVGANKTGYHLTGVRIGRDYEATEVCDLRCAVEGDICPMCLKPRLKMMRGIEVGHIFKLGYKYTESLGCTYINEEGKEAHPIMGCYGIGVSRTLAAIVEQHCDEHGIVWPMSVAPYHVIVVPLGKGENPAELQLAEKIYDQLCGMGIETMIDDRQESPGVKFKDADLIGIPVRIVVGRKSADGIVEIKTRADGEVREVRLEDAAAAAAEIVRAAL